MSQFDFPRIHFTGKSVIDTATGNNNYHYPLVTYEPITGTAVIPPRIYLNEDKNRKRISEFSDAIQHHLMRDENGLEYLEISSIDTPRRFKSWNETPLGEHPHDSQFHHLYTAIITENEKRPLKGQCPGYWNYYGTMNFAFDGVKVHALQIFSNKKVITHSSGTNTPGGFASLLGAELSFNDISGRNSAIMIDVSPTLSLYSQVFSDRISLEKDGKVIMDGRPLKASLRQMNSRRIINDRSITGASGSFCTSIPLEDLIDSQDSPIFRFFREYGSRNKILKGIFIRFDLFEIEEDQSPDYATMGAVSNPARSSVLGCLAPWYQGEMATAAPGRLLLPASAYLGNTRLGSMLAHFNVERKLLSLDAIGCFPEEKQGINQPYFSMYNLGDLQFCIADEHNDENQMAVVGVGNKGIDRETFINTGGIIDISLVKNEAGLHKLLNGGLVKIYAQIKENKDSTPQRAVVLQESKYRIISDQTGQYADQGDIVEDGLLSNCAKKEACIIRVMQHGKPIRHPVKMTVIELSVNPFGCGEKLKILDEIDQFHDGHRFRADTSKAANIFYVFFPEDGSIFPADVKRYILTTGAFINVRILPEYNFDKYLDPVHPDYTGAIDFNVIYQEFLMHYDLIYPASGIITPFKAGYFKKIRNYLRTLMSTEYWHRYRYMPSSRDLPKVKRELLFHWLENQIKEEEAADP